MVSIPVDIEKDVEKSRGRTLSPPESVQEERLARIRVSMDERDLDAVLLYGDGSHPDVVRHLTGYAHVFHYAYSLVLIPSEGAPALLIDQGWHMDEAEKMSWIDDIGTLPPRSGSSAKLAAGLGEVLESRSVADGTIGILDTYLPSKMTDALREGAPGAEVVDGSQVWGDYVRAPSEYDLDMLRQTAAVADEGMATVKETARAGRTEREICLASYNRMASLGAEFFHECANDTHVNMGSFSDVVSNVRPYLFTNNRLDHGQMFWVDMTAQYEGYHIDFCRTLSIGEPTAEQEHLFETVDTMYDEMVDALEPGVPAETLWDVGYEIAEEAGYGDYVNFIYFGHSSGIETTERPFAQEGDSDPIREGSLYNLEPGIFHPEIGSAGIENTLHVTSDGVEKLNQISTDLHIV